MSRELAGVLALPEGLARGTLRFGRVLEAVEAGVPVQGGEAEATLLQAVRAGEVPLVVPGFVDTHVHGGDGGDTMDGPEGVRRLARFHLRHGTTTLLPTTITQALPSVLEALRGVRTVMEEASRPETSLSEAPLAAIAGAHLEGPFLSRERLGAQPPLTLDPTPERLDAVLATEVVRVATLAPELPGAVEAARRLARAGVRVSIGHTAAGYAEAQAVASAVRSAGGVLGYTHLFNAMSGLGSRAPGTVGAALADPEAYAELILDLHHVHPASFRVAAAAAPRLHLVTDAIRACGLAEGETELGGQRVRVQGGAARLPSGTLAGSVLTLDVALRNAVTAGVPVARAARLAATVAADYLGLDDRGRLAPGRRADLVLLDGDLRVLEVVLAGRALPPLS